MASLVSMENKKKNVAICQERRQQQRVPGLGLKLTNVREREGSFPGSLTVMATSSIAHSEPDAAFICLAEAKGSCGWAAKFLTEGLSDPEQGPTRTSRPSPPTSLPRTWQAVNCPR